MCWNKDKGGEEGGQAAACSGTAHLGQLCRAHPASAERKAREGSGTVWGEHVHVVLMFSVLEKSISLSKASVPVVLSECCL